MRRPVLLAVALGLAQPATAADVSALVRDKGLAAAAAELAAATDPSDRFALAGVLFLSGIEEAWQLRWRHGLTLSNPLMPGLQTELFANPAPEPVPADIVATLGAALIDRMDLAGEVLAGLEADADPAFTVNVADLWFDVNSSGTRDDGEGFADLALQTLLSPWEVEEFRRARAAAPDAPSPLTATIRFDAADADWMLAYTHLIGGIAEVVLAFDPTPEIARTLDLRAALAVQAGVATAGAGMDWKTEAASFADLAAITVNTLEHAPEPARIGRAREHLLEMVRRNRGFWKKVAAETDNEAEWIPNPRQTAALGFTLPEGAEETWLAVLTDGEKLLRGELLIPYWRFAPGSGINLGEWIASPAPVRLIDWVQGTAALPYAEAGPVVTPDSWRRFQMLVEGRAQLFAILLN